MRISMRMLTNRMAQGRKATNLSLDALLVAEARRLGINLSRAYEAGLMERIAQEKARLWRQENAAMLQSSNDHVDRHGLPLASYRRF